MPRQTRAVHERTPTHDDPPGGPLSKRRKIRKGTHSCWACKRKKIRCTFSDGNGKPIDLETLHNPSEALAGVVCDECRRRATPCVSQELPEVAPLSTAASHSQQIDDRLGRLEGLMEMLVKSVAHRATGASSAEEAPDAHRQSEVQQEVPGTNMLSSNQCTQTSPIYGESSNNDDNANNDVDLGPDNLQQHQEPNCLATPAATPLTRGTGTGSCIETGCASTTFAEASSPIDNASSTTQDGSNASSIRMHHEYMQRYQLLASAWPSPNDLEMILTALEKPARSGLHKVLVFSPLSTVSAAAPLPDSPASARALLVLPPAGTHVVLVALKLLYLASFLQHLHPMFDPDLERLSRPHSFLIQRILYMTTSVVTGDDTLIGSIEGLQCLVVLGIIQSNQGNLRRAWLSFRRAMTMTQLLGLHRGVPSTGRTVLNPPAPPSALANCMWFCILYADRYLSLMLGLPQGFPGDSHVLNAGAKRKRLAASQPNRPSSDRNDAGTNLKLGKAWDDLRKIEEAHAVIAGRIIERNEAWRREEEQGLASDNDDAGDNNSSGDDLDTDLTNPLSTQSIDVALLQASRRMPAQWWLVPVLSDTGDGDDGATNFVRTQQLFDQLFHYHLLTQLHLPYMLRRNANSERRNHLVRGVELLDDTNTAAYAQQDASNPGGGAGSVDKYAYSKITCVSASREVLRRFLSLRSCKQVTFSCRCIDFFALLASMTLFHAHIDSHRSEQLQLRARERARARARPPLPQQQHGKEQTVLPTSDFLTHQRLSDRGMMERVLQSMEDMATLNDEDALSAKSAAFLRRMLDLEQDASLAVAATLGCHEARDEMQQREADARRSKTDGDLRVWVPFLGTIRITKDGILRVKGNACSIVLSAEAPNAEQQTQGHVAEGINPSVASAGPKAGPTASTTTTTTTTTITAPFPSLVGTAATANTWTDSGLLLPTWPLDGGFVPSNRPYPDNLYPFYSPGSVPNSDSTLGSINTMAFGRSGNDAGSGYRIGNESGVGQGDDWTLQGVDFAFFENLLLHGGVSDDTTGDANAPPQELQLETANDGSSSHITNIAAKVTAKGSLASSNSKVATDANDSCASSG